MILLFLYNCSPQVMPRDQLNSPEKHDILCCVYENMPISQTKFEKITESWALFIQM